MMKFPTRVLLLTLALTLFATEAFAQQQYIRRAAVTGRSGPASYFDAVVVLKKSRAVTVVQTMKRWTKVKAGKHTVWIPSNGLVKARPKGHVSMSRLEVGDISSSPAGLAAAAKGFASSFAKKVKAKQIDTLMGSSMTRAGFEAYLAKFHSRHPERSVPFPGEYLAPPFNAEWESKLGLAIAAKLVGHYGLADDAKQMRDLTLLANIIGLQTARFEIPWKVFILDSDDLNAYGLTDGYILITRGLLAKCKSEQERAAILAHEIAHVVRYHNLQELAERKTALKAASAEMEMDAALEESFGKEEKDADFEELEAFALQAYTSLHKGRLENYEYEADHLAVVYLYRTGLNPQALVNLLGTVQRIRGDSEAYSGHPPFSKRIQTVQKHISRLR